ncbi:MAG: hypothetical protein Q7J76_12805 [Candidatus Brocadiaceae bacterium]|uniref:hypothetical protein n=1 Tax=Candidatus Wunengus sp. YC61 TaxID=3367698 RepID=UPI002723B78E|nr:hypothetical protein [Candidatus Brocadiaceae bacterium]
MVNGATPAASKLLEQIKRLSTQTNKKEINSRDFENEVKNVRMNNIKNIPKGSDSENIEKIHKKSEVFAQTFKNVTQGDTAKNIQTTGIADPLTIEKRNRREPLGSFLDIYI